MTLYDSVPAMQAAAEAARCAGRRLALVPTMGALHEGHLALVRQARAHADHVTVSIFVNPTQFGPGEDFDRYPRTLDADREALKSVGGVDALFVPSVEAMYPSGTESATRVVTTGLDRHLCGAFRPGHFDGVTTVVSKLYLACRPHVAVFGQKDAQQLVILKRMTADLGFGIEVVGVQTQREPDGLARSSRNRYLTPEERAQAVVLSQALEAAREQIEGGETDGASVEAALQARMAARPLARVQYAQVVEARSLKPVARIEPGQEVLAAVAVYFGATRLIDNAFVRAPGAKP